MFYFVVLFIFNSVCLTDEFIVTIPATSYSDWIYFSVENNSVVDIANPELSTEWDFAFQRKHIRTNGGMSGIGNGAAYVDSSKVWGDYWGQLNDIPENVKWLKDRKHYDFYDLQTHTFVEGIKNPALNSWGWFNDSYQLVPTNYTMFAKCANGTDVIKIWAYDYYENSAGGNVSFRYQTGLSVDLECNNIQGDVNNDGTINVVDIVGVVGYVLETTLLEGCQLETADVNADNEVNIVDIVSIVTIILES